MIKSRSYIIIECAADAIPRYNKIQLRTNPPTFIELQPGKNILTVEKYPDLKYGFRQIDDFDSYCEEDLDDCPYVYNCGGVLRVDLTHFDPTEMTSMDWMFLRMENLSEIEFGNIKIDNVISMDSTFEMTGCEKRNVPGSFYLRNIKLSEVTNMECLFCGCEFFHVVDFRNCDLSKVEIALDIFGNNSIRNLLLDGAKLSDVIIDEIANEDWDCLESVSLKGCDTDTIINVINAFADILSEPHSKLKIILSKGVDYRLTSDGNVQIIRNYTVSDKHYKIKGKKLERWKTNGKIAIVPYGITRIGEKSFEGLDNLEVIILPETILNIGDKAFENCSNLKAVQIPRFTLKIGYRVFDGCKSIKDLYIPDSVTEIGSLGYLHLDTLRLPLKFIPNGILMNARTRNLIIGLSENGSCCVADLIGDILGMDYIDSSSWPNIVFEAPSNLDAISVLSIYGALIANDFDYGRVVYSVSQDTLIIPDSVSRIEAYSIARRSNPLFIPDSVTSIHEDAFHDEPGYKMPMLITRESNYKNLKRILPESLRGIRICTI